MPEERTLSQKRNTLYVIGFILNLAHAIPTYINSTFLSQFTTEALVGIVYTAASLVSVLCFVHIPTLLRKFGNFRVALSLLATNALGLVGLMTLDNALSIVAAFIVSFASSSLVNFSVDVFLESFSNDTRTGKIRGTFLSIVSASWFIAPALAPFILMNDRFGNIYAASLLLTLPVIGLVFGKLREFKDPLYTRVPIWKSVGEVWSNRDIKGVLMAQLLLQFFYAWMIIYMPIHLHETIGFDWTTIGIIFSIMLVPFVVLEAPLGRLADERFGEKEIMSIGFVIMAASTGVIPFVTDGNAVVWAAILLMSRVGAAMVESMADVYFFKKVDASKTHLISFSRMARPLAYVISPIVATILFFVFDMRGLFVFLGFLMLYGLRYSLSIKDTLPAGPLKA